MEVFPFLLTLFSFILIYIFALPVIRYHRREANEYRFSKERLLEELSFSKDTEFVIMSLPQNPKGRKKHGRNTPGG